MNIKAIAEYIDYIHKTTNFLSKTIYISASLHKNDVNVAEMEELSFIIAREPFKISCQSTQSFFKTSWTSSNAVGQYVAAVDDAHSLHN